jgi:septum formation protein
MPSQLILASASPRRRQLLACLGLDFGCERADIDETPWPGENPIAHARRLALTKADVVVARQPQAIVLAADTVVVLEGQILGKPVDADEARQMLRALRSRPHEVISAVAVVASGRTDSAEHSSRVWMRDYTDAEIEAYIATGDPLDKAGAYAIQHPNFRPVARFEGCFASIMGLPLGLVADLLTLHALLPNPTWPAACHAITGQCCHLPSPQPPSLPTF